MYKLERHLAALLTHIDISVMDQQVQGRKNLLNCPHRWWWVFVSTQIHNHPCHISQEADRDIRFDKGEQRMHYTQGNYIVSKLGAISNYITCNSTLSPPVTKPTNETTELRKNAEQNTRSPHKMNTCKNLFSIYHTILQKKVNSQLNNISTQISWDVLRCQWETDS